VQLELKRSATFVVALAFGTFVGSSKVDAAQTDFDGLWGVEAKVEQGDGNCVYLPLFHDVQIYRGSITSAPYEYNFTLIKGHVDKNGSVRAHLREGDHIFQGTGMLSQTSGSGSWHSKHCAGSWNAIPRKSAIILPIN
jgi:hypothetical protein